MNSRRVQKENYTFVAETYKRTRLPTADNVAAWPATGEVGSPFAWLLSQRASGVSVVRLSIGPGKSTEMENEIAARPRARAHRRGVREMRDLSTLSALRSRCRLVGGCSAADAAPVICFNNGSIMRVKCAARRYVHSYIYVPGAHSKAGCMFYWDYQRAREHTDLNVGRLVSRPVNMDRAPPCIREIRYTFVYATPEILNERRRNAR